MKHLKKFNESFQNCEYFKIGDKVKLSSKASIFKSGNSNIPQYKIDGLNFDTEYVVTDVTPIMKVSGGDQQFLSINNSNITYPCYCFEK